MRATTLRGVIVGGLVAAVAAGSGHAEEAFVLEPLHMRAGPGSQYGVLAVIPRDGAVVLHGCELSLRWCDVSYGPRRGWVFRRYIRQIDAGPPTAEPPSGRNWQTAGAIGGVGGLVAGTVIAGPIGAVIGGAAGATLGAAAGAAGDGRGGRP